MMVFSIERRYWSWCILIFIVKLLAFCLFSSCYVQNFFVPFVNHFVTYGDNTWQYFYQNHNGIEFPYNPLMLYILSFFSWIFLVFGVSGKWLHSVALKLPSLCADLLIIWLLFRLFPAKTKAILIFYIASPIVFYAIYMHSQLDLIPMALLFLSLFLLKKRTIYFAAACFGLAISTKLHVIAALPLLFVYVLRNFSFKKACMFVGIPLFIYIFFIVPYILSLGFYHLVLTNSKQMLMFDVSVTLGKLKIYLPFAALFIVYGRFWAYKKINQDLLDSFMGIVFSLFVLLVVPAPGWYVWLIPFLSIFLIKVYDGQLNVLLLHSGLSCAYLVFFVFCYKPELCDLTFLLIPVQYKIVNTRLCNGMFTVLEVCVVLAVYALYKFGVKSNEIYKRKAGLVVGIGGDSGSGKSTLMLDIKSVLGDRVTELEGDGDHKWERHDPHWQQFTHLHPKANYIHRQAEQIMRLKRGECIARVNYDHHTGKFTDSQNIAPNDVIILSGLHPFYLPKMRKLIDVKIYLDPDQLLRVNWKLTRDAVIRGYTKEKIIEQLDRRKEDTKKFIEPQRGFADIIINYFINEDQDTQFKLKVILDSSIKLDGVVLGLQKANIAFEWDYADDLATQYIVLLALPNKDFVIMLARSVVANIDELIGRSPEWQDGYRGFVQVLILLLLSEKMRENGDSEYV